MAVVTNVINANSVTPLPVSRGGTGLSTITANAIVIGNGASALSTVGPLTNGQLVIGSTGVAPVAAALTAGAGISITNAAGSITIANTASASSFVAVSGTSQTAVANTRYSCQNAAVTTVTLPASPLAGDVVSVRAYTAGGFKLTAGSGTQVIQMGTVIGTAGASVDSISQGDILSVEAQIAGASAVWFVTSGVGNLTVN